MGKGYLKIRIGCIGCFSGSSAGKEFTCNVGDLGSIPGLWRSPGGGHGNTFQYSCLVSSIDCWAAVHGVAEFGMAEWLSATQHTYIYGGFLDDSHRKDPSCNEEDPSSTPRSGRSPGEGNGYPLQCSCLQNSMDRGAWWAIAHGVAKSWTWLRNYHFSYVCVYIHVYVRVCVYMYIYTYVCIYKVESLLCIAETTPTL